MNDEQHREKVEQFLDHTHTRGGDVKYPVLPKPVGYIYGGVFYPEDKDGAPVFSATQMHHHADATCALRGAQKESGWRPISEAPKDATPVDLWRNGERLTNMRRVDLRNGNVFYEPVESGYSCVRDATYFMPLPSAPTPEGEAK